MQVEDKLEIARCAVGTYADKLLLRRLAASCYECQRR